MAERRPTIDLRAIETELAGLAAGGAFPPTPDLARAVRARLADPAVGGRRRAGWWSWPTGAWRLPGAAWPLLGPARRSLVLALLALFVVVAAAVGVGIGLRGLSIVFVPESPTPPTASGGPSASPAPTATVGDPRPALGTPTTLAEARATAGVPILVPAFGPPDEVYIRRFGADGTSVSLLYRPRPELPEVGSSGVGLLVTATTGRIEKSILLKEAGPRTAIDFQPVGGSDGFWISGETHRLVILDPSGEPIADSARRVGDTLAWQRDSVVYRVEGRLGRQATVAIAESLSPLP